MMGQRLSRWFIVLIGVLPLFLEVQKSQSQTKPLPPLRPIPIRLDPPPALPFPTPPGAVCLPAFPSLLDISPIKPFSFPSQSEALSKIAIQYAIAHETAQALQVSEKISEPHWQAKTLLGIVEQQRPRQPEQVQSLLKKATQLTQKIQAEYWRYDILQAIAGQYAELNQLESAYQTVRLIADPRAADQARVQIVAGLMAAGSDQQAKLTLQTISDESARRRALLQISRQYAKSGRYTQAFQFIRTFPPTETFNQSESLEVVVRQAAQSGAIDQVVPQLAQLPDNCAKHWLVQRIAAGPPNSSWTEKTKLTEQDFSLALSITKAIQEPSLREQALTDIAIRYAQAGQFQQGVQLASQLSNSARSRAFAKIAALYLEQQQPEAALALVEAIDANPFDKVDLLTQLAQNYSQSGQKERAMKLLAQALKTVDLIRSWP